jgi:NAD(P)-dependent dehydrogenase (short-subunit alcohol dehydrogenase family)
MTKTTIDRHSQVWLITGATSGFGRALAEEVIGRGDTVIGAARSPERLDDLVAAHPNQASAVELDVTDTGRCREIVEEVVGRFGRLDVLVNTPGEPRWVHWRKRQIANCAPSSISTSSGLRR